MVHLLAALCLAFPTAALVPPDPDPASAELYQAKKGEVTPPSIGLTFGLADMKDSDDGAGTFMEVYLDLPVWNRLFSEIRMGTVSNNGSDDEFSANYFSMGLGYDFEFPLESKSGGGTSSKVNIRPTLAAVFQFNQGDFTASGNKKLLDALVTDAAVSVDDSVGFCLGTSVVYSVGMVETGLFLGWKFMDVDYDVSGNNALGNNVLASSSSDVGGFVLGFSFGVHF